MKFNELLAFIPEEQLDFLSIETKVDLQVKKLKGAVMFKLLLYSLLENDKPSLRVMENYFNSSKFKFLANTAGVNTKFNSIGDRLSTINSEYLEKIFNHLFEKYIALLGEKKSLQIYDSTMIGLSSKLVDWAMKSGRKTNKVQLKFTEVYSIFYKSTSWVKPKEKTDEVLSHEQGHFDIAEIAARKIRKQLVNQKFKKRTAMKKFKRIIYSVSNEMTKMQELYDRETDFHRNKEQQKNWDEKIKNELKELDDYQGRHFRIEL